MRANKLKVKTLKAKEALVASERAGNTMSLLLQDFENQGANATESILQESDTWHESDNLKGSDTSQGSAILQESSNLQ